MRAPIRIESIPKACIFVAGEWRDVDDARQITNVCPIDGAVIGGVAASSRGDVDRAVDEVLSASQDWADRDADTRATYLNSLADAILAHEAELAALDVQDAGLTVSTARRDIRAAVRQLRFYSGLASEIKGSTFTAGRGRLAFSQREAYGPVARITAFNHPIRFAVQAIGPVLVAGNSVIIKPSEHTSLSTLALGQISRDVIPPGVLNVITGLGSEAGAGLVSNGHIRRIGFTGSVETGKAILSLGAEKMKHVTLELGGKNPLVICEGSSVDFAADIALRGMNFGTAGQSCQSTSRVLIHRTIYREVVQMLGKMMSRLTVGDPRSDETDVGPVAFREHYERVRQYIRTAQDEGARLVVGGEPEASVGGSGFYIWPTLFADVSMGMRVAREEIFGPVVVAVPYSSEEELLAAVNDTEYGLYARVVAPRLDVGLNWANVIQAGTVLVNTAGQRALGMPFGGYKESGIGKQGCIEEVLSYTQEKGIVVSNVG